MFAQQYRAQMAARRTLQRAVVFSIALHGLLVSSFGITSFIAGQRGRLTDISSETALQMTFAPREESSPEVAVEVPQEAPPEPEPPQPTKEVVEAPRDDAFGKMVENLPEPTPGVVPQPDVTPAKVSPEKWVEAPAPPTPPQDPKASFAGVEANPARRIVYLIDGSGPMAASLTFIKAELASSVARLNPDQNFQVIVFRQPASGGTSGAAPLSYYYMNANGEPDLTAANVSAKGNVRAWIDSVSPVGKSEPLMGIEAALRLQPDIIFLLARGIARSGGIDIEQRNQQVLAMLDRINPKQMMGGRLARIKTIQFLEDDPTGLMQAIAREHGDGEGSYRLVTRAEVGKTK